MRTLTRRLPGALALAACAAHAAVGGSLTLHASAVVDGEVIRLGDVADLSGGTAEERARLAGWVLAESPRLGQSMRVVRRRVASALPPGWAVAGAADVIVTRAAQQVSAASLCAEALKAVRTRVADLAGSTNAEATCRDKAARDVALPDGTLALDADANLVRVVDGPQSVSVRASVDGRVVGQYPVSVLLAATTRRWCAKAAMPANSLATPEAFEACRQPVRHESEVGDAPIVLTRGRLRHAIRAGQALAASDLVEPNAVLAGDSVTVHYRAGSFDLAARGTLVHDARLGESVRVRLGQARETVSGRLVADGVVDMEESL